jgi:hypothetical protein
MNISQFIKDEVFDTPTLHSDLSALISPVRLGIWTSVLNALTCFAAFICVNVYSQQQVAQEMAALELGQLLSIVLLGCIGGFYTIFVPVRTCGLFMGPRTGKYFDQIVLSGISPFRYMIGKVVAQNVFFALIIVFLLPYFILVLFLGGIDVGFIVTSIVLLMIYVNLLALATLWLSVYITEAAAALTVIAITGPLYLYGFNVADQYNPMVMTPAVTFVAPIYEIVHQADNLARPYLLFAAVFIGFGVLFAALSLLHLIIGPLPGIVRANSTFGEIVFKGDAKRKSALRKRLALQRAAQILFFYENRPVWTERVDVRIRWGTAFAGILIVTIGAFGILYRTASEFNRHEYNVMLAVITTCSLLLACIFFCETLNTETTLVRVREGKYWRAGSVDTLFAAIFFPLPLILSAITLALQELNAPTRWNGAGPTVKNTDGTTWAGANADTMLIIVACMFSYYAFFRWQTMKSWYRGGVIAISLVLYAVFFCLAPVMPLALVETSSSFYPAARAFQSISEQIAVLSPVMAIAATLGEMPRSFDGLVVAPIVLLHLAFGLLMARMAVRRHRKLINTVHGVKQEREGEDAAGQATPEPQPQPQPEAGLDGDSDSSDPSQGADASTADTEEKAAPPTPPKDGES